MRSVSETSEQRMIIGWKYGLKDISGDELSGVFGGYAVLGSETAVTLDTKQGTVYVPVGKITRVTLLERTDHSGKDKERPGVHYG